jgi:hypothetical protein
MDQRYNTDSSPDRCGSADALAALTASGAMSPRRQRERRDAEHYVDLAARRAAASALLASGGTR